MPDTLSQLIRTAFIPREGTQFLVADFSAIEARVIAWFAGEEWRQKVFAKGGDIYCASASQMFKVPVEKHGINGHLRQKGKIAELLFEFDGDQKHIRHVLYNCSASRPGIEGKTNEDSKEVQTAKLSLKAVPLANGMVKAKTGNTTDTTTYTNWYKAVYMPTAENTDVSTQAASKTKAVKE